MFIYNAAWQICKKIFKINNRINYQLSGVSGVNLSLFETKKGNEYKQSENK